MLELRELSWKISLSSTIISVFFITFSVFYVSRFGFWISVTLAIMLSLTTALLIVLKKDKILKPPL
ncbi:MAG: hypothetical protein DSO00_04025 [Archaeoglobi archaeon]|nr:MAG: hypothetical protein DSO00_04025 [Archaeoglobi archaeon]